MPHHLVSLGTPSLGLMGAWLRGSDLTKQTQLAGSAFCRGGMEAEAG